MQIDSLYWQKYENSKKIFATEIPEWRYGQRKLIDRFWFSVNGVVYIIEPGFWWNGASIPKFAWSMVGSPWDDEVYFGALIHDMIYGAKLFEKSIGDEIFYRVNRASGMSWSKAQAMDKALDIGGHSAYKGTPESIAGCKKHLTVEHLHFCGIPA